MPPDTWSYPFCGWQAIVRQFIWRGANLNQLGYKGTVLLQVLVGAYSLEVETDNGLWFANFHEFVKYPSRGVQALYTWLETLYTAGVDLEDYGKTEILVQQIWLREIPLYSHPSCKTQKTVSDLRLTAIEVGPKPRDLKFWFSDPTDQFVGEFWDMIEHPERLIPGAWDDFSW